MIGQIFRNLPPVVKNLVILNLVMYIVTWIGQMQGVELTHFLGGYVFNSPFFEPYQLVTHFFMHGGFFHIFFNMFALIIFGPPLEKVWGPKRFFIFYVICAIGAFFLHQLVGYLEIKNLEKQLIDNGMSINQLNDLRLQIAEIPPGKILKSSNDLVQNYVYDMVIPVVGASGAVFGLLVAFASLFPNTKLMLLFPPIPIKAKWLVIGMIGLELYYSFQNNPGDNVAHLAHIGGALFGFIMVMIWKKSTKNFY